MVSYLIPGSFLPDAFRRTLLYLQLIQIQAQLANASSSTNILKEPEYILMFVKHALEDTQMSRKPQMPVRRPKRAGLGLDDLRIVPDPDDEDELSSGAAMAKVKVLRTQSPITSQSRLRA